MKRLLNAYKVIATVVGVLLIVLCLIGLPLDLFASGNAHDVGRWIAQNVGVAHGWLYMIYLVVTFMLARRAGWDLPFAVVTLICGTIPIASFWAEFRVLRHTRLDAVLTPSD